MQKRLVVLIDFSENSSNLLQYTEQWSRQIGAKILLVHRNDILIPGLADNDSRNKLLTFTTEKALDTLKKLRDSTIEPATDVSYHVSELPWPLLFKEISSPKYDDLIISGLKGKGLLERIFIGSTSVDLIEHTNTILAAIPSGIHEFYPRKVSVAVSGKHPFNVLAFNNLLAFFNGIEKINFFHWIEPGEEDQNISKQLNDLVNLFSDRFDCTSRIFEGSASSSNIQTVIQNKEEEFVVLQRGTRFVTDHLFRNFMTNELVYEGLTPMVVLP